MGFTVYQEVVVFTLYVLYDGTSFAVIRLYCLIMVGEVFLAFWSPIFAWQKSKKKCLEGAEKPTEKLVTKASESWLTNYVSDTRVCGPAVKSPVMFFVCFFVCFFFKLVYSSLILGPHGCFRFYPPRMHLSRSRRLSKANYQSCA